MTAIALTWAPVAARGPEKNDSVNGHGIVDVGFATTNEFKVSAHAIGSFTTAATGNMYVSAVTQTELGPVRVDYWADVFCISVLGPIGEVRGHVYRTDPDVLSAPADLVFYVADVSSLQAQPDEFAATTATAPSACADSPALDTNPLAKGNISVNDESPI